MGTGKRCGGAVAVAAVAAGVLVAPAGAGAATPANAARCASYAPGGAFAGGVVLIDQPAPGEIEAGICVVNGQVTDVTGTFTLPGTALIAPWHVLEVAGADPGVTANLTGGLSRTVSFAIPEVTAPAGGAVARVFRLRARMNDGTLPSSSHPYDFRFSFFPVTPGMGPLPTPLTGGAQGGLAFTPPVTAPPPSPVGPRPPVRDPACLAVSAPPGPVTLASLAADGIDVEVRSSRAGAGAGVAGQ